MQIFSDWPVTPLEENFMGANFRGFPTLEPYPLMVCIYVHMVSLTILHANLLKSEQESSIMEESSFNVEAMVRGYHIY